MQAILNAVIGLFLVFSDLSFVWATKWAVDIATAPHRSLSLRPAIFSLAVIIIVQLGLGIASKWIKATLGVRAQNRMQRSIFQRLLDCKWKEMKRFHTGNLMNRLERDVSDVVGFLTESIPSLLCTVVQFLGAFVFLFWMDRTLACIIVLVLPFFLLSSKLYVKKMRKITHDIRDLESRIQAVLQESLQHTLVVKTLERTSSTVEKLSSFQRLLRKEIVRKTKYSTTSSTLMNLGFALGYLFTFTWGTVSLHRGLITYGALIAFVQLVGQIQQPVKQLTRFIPVFIGCFTATERLMELENIPLEKKEKEKRLENEGGIVIRNLSFSYMPTGRKIFENFDFDFPAGSVTAILGETGTGKTTLIRLLLALVQPQAGNIVLFDRRGNSFEVSPATRCNFSYVPQGNTLFSGSIRDNLLKSNPDASDQELYEVLRLAGADFVATQLPEKLNTLCGEFGDGLSEGQAQRIAIARALLKDSPFLLLDEATSALDQETESRVIENIITHYKKRTLIFVTHRPEVLKYCTQTFTLHKQMKP